MGWLGGTGTVEEGGARDAGRVGEGEAVGSGGLGLARLVAVVLERVEDWSWSVYVNEVFWGRTWCGRACKCAGCGDVCLSSPDGRCEGAATLSAEC